MDRPVEVIEVESAKALLYYDTDAEDPRKAFDFYSEAEVQAWEAGEVFGWTILDRTGEVVDSCWGFYGYEFAEEEAKRAAEYVHRATFAKAFRMS